MQSIREFLARVLATLVRLTLWLFTAVLALLLLAVAMVLLFFGVLWALVRGKRPVQPVFVGRFRQYASQKVWPGGPGGPGARRDSAEVVDIEVREVREGREGREGREPDDVQDLADSPDRLNSPKRPG